MKLYKSYLMLNTLPQSKWIQRTFVVGVSSRYDIYIAYMYIIEVLITTVKTLLLLFWGRSTWTVWQISQFKTFFISSFLAVSPNEVLFFAACRLNPQKVHWSLIKEIRTVNLNFVSKMWYNVKDISCFIDTTLSELYFVVYSFVFSKAWVLFH